jgi:hypothetical protein
MDNIFNNGILIAKNDGVEVCATAYQMLKGLYIYFGLGEVLEHKGEENIRYRKRDNVIVCERKRENCRLLYDYKRHKGRWQIVKKIEDETSVAAFTMLENMYKLVMDTENTIASNKEFELYNLLKNKFEPKK